MARIRFRNRIETSLNDLLETGDVFTLEAFNEGKNMEDIKYRMKDETDKLREELFCDFGKLPEIEKEFIDRNITELDDPLKRRGEKHISDLSHPAKLNLLRQEGGEGYTIRFLNSKWGKLATAYTSIHPVP